MIIDNSPYDRMSPKDLIAAIFKNAREIHTLAGDDQRIKAKATLIQTAAAHLPRMAQLLEDREMTFRENLRHLDRKHVEVDRLFSERIQLEAAPELEKAGLSPHGFFVYLLCGEDGQVMYVGQSTNILSRLGSHMGARWKREGTVEVKLIRCSNNEQMMRLETLLIRQHAPPWNTAGVDYRVLQARREAKRVTSC